MHPWQDSQQKPLIQLENVSKFFGPAQALDSVSLNIYAGEFFSILGPSGCGKTTMLRLLGGFEKPSAGRIHIGGIDVTETPPYDLPVNTVFQSYALFPHMTVEENVAFGLRQKNIPQRAVRSRVNEMLELVTLQDYRRRRPDQLSGGQKQRTALARALCLEPQVLLLDEPMAALDKALREKTQFEIVNIQEKLGITFVMVTHDQEEAMTVSTRVAVMEQGQLRQVGTPGEIYEYPNSLSVAKFIGSINIFEGIVVGEEPEYILVKSPELDCELAVAYSASVPVGGRVFVALRPEKVMITSSLVKMGHNTTLGVVKDIAYLGDVSVYYVKLESGKIVMVTQPNLVRLAERPVTWDSEVFLKWRAENTLILTV